MSVWSVGDITQGIAGTLRKAAQATGAGFDYLVKTAMRESSMDPAAKAASSSAAGMFQFVEGTWLEMVKVAGPKHGLEAEAAAISRTADGRYAVTDAKAKASILALRHDPEISALMAGEFTERNNALLTAQLRRPPSEGELYAAHFLGAQGAVDLINLASTTPGAKAAPRFPEAAAANRSIFYSGGKARSASDVLAQLVNKHGRAPAWPANDEPPMIVAHGSASFFTNAPPTGPAMAYAEDRPVFHSMFQTGRGKPVSAYVQGVWTGLVPAKPVAATGPLDLSSFLKPASGSSAKPGEI